MTTDPFAGQWELDPSTLNYQKGQPGRRAVYVIEPTSDGMMFHLDADDAAGNPMRVSYGGPLDGTLKPWAGGDGTLAVVLRRPETHRIESLLLRGDTILDRWTRELLPDGQAMRITQHVANPEGGEFLNTAIYRRVG